jgi:hypothetical protein
MKKLTTLFLIVLSFTQQACTQQADSSQENLDSTNSNTLTLADTFGDYWYQGKAELTSYNLTQVRYGEKRQGQAVLVYVTEDFSKSKQVKLDNPSANQADAEKVLKLNFTKKFNTGIYPYSIMSSVFSPVYPSDNLHAVKLTTSVQEWCGHMFMQFNKDNDNYKVLTRSYFESEGDENINIALTWLEDEFWNLIRLDPQSIPQGNVKIIPSSMYLRLKHQPTAAYKASVERDHQGEQTILIVKYPDLNRSLKISYTTAFPHQIQSWEESYPENGQIMTTTGQLNERVMLDYWNRNSVADSTYRDILGLK